MKKIFMFMFSCFSGMGFLHASADLPETSNIIKRIYIPALGEPALGDIKNAVLRLHLMKSGISFDLEEDAENYAEKMGMLNGLNTEEERDNVIQQVRANVKSFEACKFEGTDAHSHVLLDILDFRVFKRFLGLNMPYNQLLLLSSETTLKGEGIFDLTYPIDISNPNAVSKILKEYPHGVEIDEVPSYLKNSSSISEPGYPLRGSFMVNSVTGLSANYLMPVAYEVYGSLTGPRQTVTVSGVQHETSFIKPSADGTLTLEMLNNGSSWVIQPAPQSQQFNQKSIQKTTFYKL